jgi:hypothetical protein
MFTLVYWNSNIVHRVCFGPVAPGGKEQFWQIYYNCFAESGPRLEKIDNLLVNVYISLPTLFQWLPDLLLLP